MFTKYESGAEVEIEEVYRYENGAEVEAEAVYAYKNGAEEEVWSSGIEPYGVYVYSTSYNSVTVDGSDITMTCKYANRSGQWARLIVEIPNEATGLTISIDSLMAVGEGRAVDTTSTLSVVLRESDNIYTGSLTSDYNIPVVTTLYSGLATESKGISDYEETFAVSSKYLYLQFGFTKGTGYDSDLSGEPLTLKISDMRLNGKRIKGNISI